jgi:sulfofructose kinase
MEVNRLDGPSDRFNLRFPPNKPFDIVGFGLNAVDHLCVVPHYPELDTKTEIIHHEILGGGQVATAVACVTRLGLRGKYIGKVGADESGRFSLASLVSETMDTTSVIVQEGAVNQFAVITIDQESGERTILWHRDPALNFREGELKREDLCAGRLLLLDGHDDFSRAAARWAGEEGIPVVIDLDEVVPGCAELMESVDFLITNAAFPAKFTGIRDRAGSLLALRRYCKGFIAATMGAEGALAVLGDRCVRFPAFPVRAVDTTGAGDVFHGGFIYGLLQNWTLGRIMDFANAAAALSCCRLGARAGIPSLVDVAQLVGTRT